MAYINGNSDFLVVVTNTDEMNKMIYGYSGDDLYVYPDKTVEISEIEGNTLAGNTTIKCVVIPKSVTEIGECAFSDCTALEVVKVYGQLEKIGKMAFENCSNLKSIEYLAKDEYGRTLTAKALGTGAFLNSGLTSIDVTTTRTFANSAFKDCYNLQAIHCASLADWLDFVEGAKAFGSINANPLYMGHNLVIGGSRVKNLDLMAIAQHTKATIPQYAFVGGAFSYIKIPRCIENIEVRAFASNPKTNILDLTDYGSSVAFPTIDYNAFAGHKPTLILVPSGRKTELMSATNWSNIASNGVVEEV